MAAFSRKVVASTERAAKVSRAPSLARLRNIHANEPYNNLMASHATMKITTLALMYFSTRLALSITHRYDYSSSKAIFSWLFAFFKFQFEMFGFLRVKIWMFNVKMVSFCKQGNDVGYLVSFSLHSECMRRRDIELFRNNETAVLEANEGPIIRRQHPHCHNKQRP